MRLVAEGDALNDLAGIPKARKTVNPSNYYLVKKKKIVNKYSLSTLNGF